MQKKLVALMVAGVVSMPALAQSNVQIYGIMDLGLARHGGSEIIGGLGATDRSRTVIDSGNQAASRIGFRGSEDLGRGLKAFFQIEQGLNADRSSNPTNRQIFVGLQGDFGKLRLGRDFNPTRQLVTGLDPFGASGVGSVQNIYLLQTRVDNAVIYTSPNLAGFTLEGTFSFSAQGNERVTPQGNENEDSRLWNVVGRYERGPLMIGASYERIDSDGGEYNIGNFDDYERVRAWNVAGAYDFGSFSVRGAYGRIKAEDFNENDKLSQWMIAGVVPVSEAGRLLLSYSRVKADLTLYGDPKASQWALGYTHALSKRTNVYATYARAGTNSEAEGFFGVHEGSQGNLQFTRGINLGLRHSF